MQRAAYHHQMAGSAPPAGSYPHQGYAASAYHYGMQEYLQPPMSHHSQLGAVTTMSPHMGGSANHMSSHMSMGSHGIHGQGMPPRASPLMNGGLAGDCLDYNNKSEWSRPLDSKFHML